MKISEIWTDSVFSHSEDRQPQFTVFEIEPRAPLINAMICLFDDQFDCQAGVVMGLDQRSEMNKQYNFPIWIKF